MPCDAARLDLDSGGSDFSLSNLGAFNVTGQMRDDGVKPPFVEILENPTKVADQLQRLYDSGQRKISTVLWHAPMTGGRPHRAEAAISSIRAAD